MKKRITNWFKAHRVLRALLPGAMALLMVFAVAVPAALADAPVFPDIAGTYTMRCNLPAKFMDSTRVTSVRTGTLTITTVSAKGVISVASLTMPEIGTVALTGYVGSGSRPALSLVGSAGDVHVVINANVRHKDAVVSSISGGIDGFVGHYGGSLGNSTGDGRATWSSVEAYGGSVSALLTQDGATDTVYVQFVPPAGIKVSDLDDITSGWGFYQLFQLGELAGAQYELRFLASTNVNPDGAGHVDITVLDAPPITGTGAWVNWPMTSESVALYYGNDPFDGTPFDWHAEGAMTLAEVEDAINAEALMIADGPFSCSNWELARVRIELWAGDARTSYIDNIYLTVGKKVYTYTFEPVQFSGRFTAR